MASEFLPGLDPGVDRVEVSKTCCDLSFLAAFVRAARRLADFLSGAGRGLASPMSF